MNRLEIRIEKLEDAKRSKRYGFVVVHDGEDAQAKQDAYIAEQGKPRKIYIIHIAD